MVMTLAGRTGNGKDRGRRRQRASRSSSSPPPGGGRSARARGPGGGGSVAADAAMPHHPTPDRRRRSDPPPPGEGGRTAKQSAPSPAALLSWFDRHRRVLPWRAPPGEDADPHPLGLSRTLLPQTTATGGGPYYSRF